MERNVAIRSLSLSIWRALAAADAHHHHQQWQKQSEQRESFRLHCLHTPLVRDYRLWVAPLIPQISPLFVIGYKISTMKNLLDGRAAALKALRRVELSFAD